jgi:hypothetical protein
MRNERVHLRLSDEHVGTGCPANVRFDNLMSGNIPFDKLFAMKINCQINDQDSTCTFSGSTVQRLKNAYNIYLYWCAALRLQGHVL